MAKHEAQICWDKWPICDNNFFLCRRRDSPRLRHPNPTHQGLAARHAWPLCAGAVPQRSFPLFTPTRDGATPAKPINKPRPSVSWNPIKPTAPSTLSLRRFQFLSIHHLCQRTINRPTRCCHSLQHQSSQAGTIALQFLHHYHLHHCAPPRRYPQPMRIRFRNARLNHHPFRRLNSNMRRGPRAPIR